VTSFFSKSGESHSRGVPEVTLRGTLVASGHGVLAAHDGAQALAQSGPDAAAETCLALVEREVRGSVPGK